MKKDLFQQEQALFALVARSTVRGKAIAAIHRLIAARLEGNLGLLAAVSTDRGKHFALRTGVAVGGAEGSAALRAAARLVLEALLRVERLLGSSKDEFLAAVAANEGLVLIHICILHKID